MHCAGSIETKMESCQWKNFVQSFLHGTNGNVIDLDLMPVKATALAKETALKVIVDRAKVTVKDSKATDVEKATVRAKEIALAKETGNDLKKKDHVKVIDLVKATVPVKAIVKDLNESGVNESVHALKANETKLLTLQLL